MMLHAPIVPWPAEETVTDLLVGRRSPESATAVLDHYLARVFRQR